MLRRATRGFLEAECASTLVRELENTDKGYSSELWKRMADLGWLGLAFPPHYGGTGGSLIDQVVLFEEIGRAQLPSPIFTSSVLSGQVLLNAASEPQKELLLPRMASGDSIVSLALDEPHSDEPDGHRGLRAEGDGEDHILNGTKLFVPYAHVADYLICTATVTGGTSNPTQPAGIPASMDPWSSAHGGKTIFLVNNKGPGVKANIMPSVANFKQHEVTFENVRVAQNDVVGGMAQDEGPLARAMEWATVVLCGEMVGRAEKVLDMVVEYSKVRVQFGRPIGNFQAIQHRCADLKAAVDGARLVTYQAAWKLAEGLPCSEDISMAKAFAGSLSRQAAVAGHGIFAGIAFTVEHDMQLYTMRSKVAEASLGDSDFHLDRLAEHMGLGSVPI